METYKRAGFACNCLLGVEMTLSTAAFWAHAFSDPKLSGFLVAMLLTAAFGSVSLLASGLVGRLILAARQVLLRRLDEKPGNLAGAASS